MHHAATYCGPVAALIVFAEARVRVRVYAVVRARARVRVEMNRQSRAPLKAFRDFLDFGSKTEAIHRVVCAVQTGTNNVTIIGVIGT